MAVRWYADEAGSGGIITVETDAAVDHAYYRGPLPSDPSSGCVCKGTLAIRGVPGHALYPCPNCTQMSLPAGVSYTSVGFHRPEELTNV